MNKINYQKRLEETIDKETKAGHVPTHFFAQLLCAVQQLCVRVSVQLHLKSPYFTIIRISQRRQSTKSVSQNRHV